MAPQEKFFFPSLKGHHLLWAQIYLPQFLVLCLHSCSTIAFGGEVQFPHKPELQILSYLQKKWTLKVFLNFKLHLDSCRLAFPPFGFRTIMLYFNSLFCALWVIINYPRIYICVFTKKVVLLEVSLVVFFYIFP